MPIGFLIFGLSALIAGVALSQTACGPAPQPDTTDPLHAPNGQDENEADGSRNHLERCLDPTRSSAVKVEAGGLGCGAYGMDLESTCVPGEGACQIQDQYLRDKADQGWELFKGTLKWTAAPAGYSAGQFGTGSLDDQVWDRETCVPLSQFENASFTSQYGDLANAASFCLQVEGAFRYDSAHPDHCGLDLLLGSWSEDPEDGAVSTSDNAVVATYMDNECLAPESFDPENVRMTTTKMHVVWNGPFDENGEITADVTCGTEGTACAFVPNATDPAQSNPSSLRATFIQRPFPQEPDGGAGSMAPDGGPVVADAGPSSPDGGI